MIAVASGTARSYGTVEARQGPRHEPTDLHRDHHSELLLRGTARTGDGGTEKLDSRLVDRGFISRGDRYERSCSGGTRCRRTSSSGGLPRDGGRASPAHDRFSHSRNSRGLPRPQAHASRSRRRRAALGIGLPLSLRFPCDVELSASGECEQVRSHTTDQRDLGTFRPSSRNAAGTTRRRRWVRKLRIRSTKFVECATRSRRSSIMIRANWSSTTWSFRSGMERDSSRHPARGYESPHNSCLERALNPPGGCRRGSLPARWLRRCRRAPGGGDGCWAPPARCGGSGGACRGPGGRGTRSGSGGW